MSSSTRWQESNQTDTVVQQLAALLRSHVLVDTATSFITSVLISCVFFVVSLGVLLAAILHLFVTK
jgi:hypothetical protein